MKSDPKYAKTTSINGHAWVDALHMESEIPGFFTRYLATVKQDIGVLVTYSINKTKYQDYLNDFESMVKTLKVFRKAGMGLNAGPANSNIFANTQIPQSVSGDSVFQGTNIEGGSDKKQKPKEDDTPLWPLLLIVAGAGYYIWRKKQNR